MEKIKAVFVGIVLAVVLSGCSSPGQEGSPENITDVTRETCFEVVVPRLESQQIVYERELPWDKVPYNVREDDYNSIGTAFAVGKNRFVTAAHVLSLSDASMFYDRYYIRDSSGEVYPVTNLLRFHQDKDFAEFEVEGYEASSWLEFRDEPYVPNETVYQVGNIYGQGIVAVPGTILGDMEENRNGAWKYIKSAPPNDRGSSGGPLIDGNMKVLGVIDFKDDNFSYSLPVGEISAVEEGKGFVDSGYSYAFDLLLGERSSRKPYSRELDLPMPLNEVKTMLRDGYRDTYAQQMQAFFAEAGGLFPEGKGSASALQGASTSTRIQVLYRNEDDRVWYFSELDKNVGKIGETGSVGYANINNTIYFDLQIPDEMSHAELYDSPKAVMDTFISAVAFNRSFAGDEIRIETLGDPIRRETLTDRYDRVWHADIWAVEYADETAIMQWTAVPGGAVGILRFCASSDLDMWLFDLSVIADLVYIPYAADLSEWAEYLDHPESDQGPYRDMTLDYRDGEGLEIRSPEFDMDLPPDLIRVTDRSFLTLSRDIYEEDGKPVWGLRKINFSENKKDNFLISYRFMKPSEDLPETYHEAWEDFINREHPYNALAYTLEGHTDIGTIHPQFGPDDESVYSLYMGFEGNLDQDEMDARLETLKEVLVFK